VLACRGRSRRRAVPTVTTRSKRSTGRCPRARRPCEKSVRQNVKSPALSADTTDTGTSFAAPCAPRAGTVLVDLVGIEIQKGGSMKVFKGMYPRLALVALIVSLALASGAAKKWC